MTSVYRVSSQRRILYDEGEGAVALATGSASAAPGGQQAGRAYSLDELAQHFEELHLLSLRHVRSYPADHHRLLLVSCCCCCCCSAVQRLAAMEVPFVACSGTRQSHHIALKHDTRGCLRQRPGPCVVFTRGTGA